jgi:4-amino-4-deoxy-L-arabinose transferase-like glycosyltransferase
MTALTLRLLWVALGPDITLSDAASYDNLAARLSRGMGYVRSWGNPVPTAYRPPGYPMFLALLYAIFGRHHWVVGIAQATMGMMSCLLLYSLAAGLLGGRKGRLAGLALAVYPNHIYYASLVMSETLFVTLMLVALWMLARRPPFRASHLLVAGIAAGLSALVKPNAILLWVLAAAWLIATERGPRRAAKVLVFVLPLAAIISAWTLRNIQAMGAPILISTNGGVNFYIGNHQGATGAYHFPSDNPVLAFTSELERQRQGYRLGIEFIRSHPAQWLLLVPRKILWLVLGEADGVRWGFGDTPWPGGKPHVIILGAIATLAYWPLLLLGLAGMVRLGFRSRRGLLLSLVPISWVITHVMFFGGPRFHFSLIPIFALFAATCGNHCTKKRESLLAGVQDKDE